MWVLDFMQGRLHNLSPGDVESIFIKVGDRKTKDGLRAEEATAESLGSALLCSIET